MIQRTVMDCKSENLGFSPSLANYYVTVSKSSVLASSPITSDNTWPDSVTGLSRGSSEKKGIKNLVNCDGLNGDCIN